MPSESMNLKELQIESSVLFQASLVVFNATWMQSNNKHLFWCFSCSYFTINTMYCTYLASEKNYSFGETYLYRYLCFCIFFWWWYWDIFSVWYEWGSKELIEGRFDRLWWKWKTFMFSFPLVIRNLINVICEDLRSYLIKNNWICCFSMLSCLQWNTKRRIKKQINSFKFDKSRIQ